MTNAVATSVSSLMHKSEEKETQEQTNKKCRTPLVRGLMKNQQGLCRPKCKYIHVNLTIVICYTVRKKWEFIKFGGVSALLAEGKKGSL